MSTTTQRPTPETDAAFRDGYTFCREDMRPAVEFCAKLERDRDEARERERIAVVSWDEERLRGQREAERVIALQQQLEAMRKAIKNAKHFASIILAEAGKQWLATEPLPDVASIEAVAQQIKDELQLFLKP